MSNSSPPTPIRHLNPEVPPQSRLAGTVTLKWPYNTSSGTPTLDLMISESDPLKRIDKGRVRVRFVKRLAQRLQEEKVQNGDELDVVLEGAKWKRKEGTDVGERDIEWEIEVGEKGGTVELKKTDGKKITIDVPLEESATEHDSPTIQYTVGMKLETMPEPMTPTRTRDRSDGLRRTSSGFGLNRLFSNQSSPSSPGRIGDAFKAGIITKYSEYLPISKVVFNATLDMIGIVTRQKAPSQAKAGQRDWMLNIRIVDRSALKGIGVVISRPNRRALPDLSVPEDDADGVTAILLRNFRIQSHKRNFLAVSTRTSSWAVWKRLPAKETDAKVKAEVSGPPVEYGDEEVEYVHALGRWFWGLSPETRKELRTVRKWEE